MNKNLLEQHADQPNRSESKIEETIDDPTLETIAAPQYVEVNEAEDLFEASRTIGTPIAPEAGESVDEDETDSPGETIKSSESKDKESPFDSSAATVGETINEISGEKEIFPEANFGSMTASTVETENAASDFEPLVEKQSETPNFIFPSENAQQRTTPENAQTISQSVVEPQSFAETARQSGLAYAAAITLFASVVFMLIIGWFADLLFGTAPWGKVGGIVLGSLIGFVQLFRITSQIFKK